MSLIRFIPAMLVYFDLTDDSSVVVGLFVNVLRGMVVLFCFVCYGCVVLCFVVMSPGMSWFV